MRLTLFPKKIAYLFMLFVAVCLPLNEARAAAGARGMRPKPARKADSKGVTKAKEICIVKPDCQRCRNDCAIDFAICEVVSAVTSCSPCAVACVVVMGVCVYRCERDKCQPDCKPSEELLNQ